MLFLNASATNPVWTYSNMQVRYKKGYVEICTLHLLLLLNLWLIVSSVVNLLYLFYGYYSGNIRPEKTQFWFFFLLAIPNACSRLSNHYLKNDACTLSWYLLHDMYWQFFINIRWFSKHCRTSEEKSWRLIVFETVQMTFWCTCDKHLKGLIRNLKINILLLTWTSSKVLIAALVLVFKTNHFTANITTTFQTIQKNFQMVFMWHALFRYIRLLAMAF